MQKPWIVATLAIAALAAPLQSRAGVFLNITIAPPAIPVYEQPVAPGPDYIWTPGYWQWDASVGDYFWVPGTWVAAPQPGYLWTPGYWAFESGYYGWHAGYWGPHIGYYGGVNYGFGYFGRGFEGGYWNGPHFFYNTAYSRVNVVNVRNVYVHNVTVVNNVHTSFVGGNGGLQARPSAGEQAAFRENHLQPTGMQMQHANFARQDRSQFAGQNHGAPPAAALARPADSTTAFHQGAVAGRSTGTFNGGGAPQRGFTGGEQPGQFGNRGQNTNGVATQPNRGGQQPGQPTVQANRPVQQPIQQPQQGQPYQPGRVPNQPGRSFDQTQPQQRSPYQTQPQQPQQQRPQYQERQQQPRQEARPQPQPRQESRPAAEGHGGEHEGRPR